MNRLPLILAAGLMTLAACTSASTSADNATTTAPSQTSDAAGIWREFVTCARDNGQTQWPDAVIDDQSQATFPGIDIKTGYSKVEQTCGRILDRLPPRTNPFQDQLSPGQIEAMRRYVQCLHQNGMPDVPEPDGNGRFTQPQKYVDDPAYRDIYNAARSACDQILLDAR